MGDDDISDGFDWQDDDEEDDPSVAELQERLHDKKQELQEAEREITELEQHLSSAKGKVDELEAELEDKEARIEELRAERDTLQGRVEGALEQVGEKEARIEELETRVDQLETEKSTLEDQLQSGTQEQEGDDGVSLRVFILLGAVFGVVLFIGGLSVIAPGLLSQLSDEVDPTGGTTVEGNSTTVNTTLIETNIQQNINQYRTENNLSQLERNETLTTVARAYSQRMADEGFVAHVAPDGTTLQDRLASEGYTCTRRVDSSRVARGGENLARTSFDKLIIEDGKAITLDSEADVANHVVDEWEQSDSHRETMQKEYWETQGVGVHVTENNRVYITQVLC